MAYELHTAPYEDRHDLDDLRVRVRSAKLKYSRLSPTKGSHLLRVANDYLMSNDVTPNGLEGSPSDGQKEPPVRDPAH